MTPKQREQRTIAAAEVRVVRAEGQPPRIVGYAAVFNKPSLDLGGWRETIRPGAFRKVLEAGPDVRALVDHDPTRILARSAAQTLMLREDDKGLYVEILPADTQVGRDILTSIERGDVTGMSFSFRTQTDDWHMEDGEPMRELLEVAELYDVGPVTFPAYPDTQVAVRSLEGWKAEQAEAARTSAMKDARRRIDEAALKSA